MQFQVAEILLLPLLCGIFETEALPDVIKIGGLFHPTDDNQELAFRQAVEHINADRLILPRSKLVAQIERISPYDSFHAGKRVAVYPSSTHCSKEVTFTSMPPNQSANKYYFPVKYTYLPLD